MAALSSQATAAQPLASLLAHLHYEEQLYGCLVQLLEQVRTALITHQRPELEQALQQQERCLTLLQGAMPQRQELMAAVALEVQAPVDSSLGHLLAKVPDLRSRVQLQALQRNIHQHLGAIPLLQQQNQVLIQQAQAYVDFTLESIHDLAQTSEPAVYSHRGSFQQPVAEPVATCNFDA